MKRTIAWLLILVVLTVLLPACGKADQSGEWGAYYKAFRAYTKEFSKDTQYICLDDTGVEEENRKKLYDLFYEFCKDEGMRIVQGDWAVLYGKGLLDDAGNFTDGYLVSFDNVHWSQDRSEVTLTISLRCTTAFSESNLGGSVTVTKAGEAWDALRADVESALSDTAGAYYAVFAYYTENAGMNGLKSILSLDPRGVEEETLANLEKLLSAYASRQDFTFMKATWDGLVEKGYVNESGNFTDGYHLTYDSVDWIEDGKSVEITSWMMQGDLNALGGIFTVEWTGNGWEVTNVETMMS